MNCSNIYVTSPVSNIRNTNISDVDAVANDIVDNILNIINDVERGIHELLYLNPKTAYVNIQNSTVYLYFQVCSNPTLYPPLTENAIKIFLKNSNTQFLEFNDIRGYNKLSFNDIERTKNTIKNEIYKDIYPKTGPRPTGLYEPNMIFQGRSFARVGGLRMGEISEPLMGRQADRSKRESSFSRSQFLMITTIERASLSLNMDDHIENAKYNEALRIFNVVNNLENEKVKEIYNYIVDNKISDLYVNLAGTVLHIDKNTLGYITLYINVISMDGKPLSVYDDLEKHITGFYLDERYSSWDSIPNGFLLHDDYDTVIQYIEDNVHIQISDLPPLSKNENDILEEVD
ncbi:Hypothetical protein ORPV_1128 [Orpheovirus IHUMI-LCC2]|uniref:Uncharacterized protein n=1 Tax=Orpheovirus IHUMI-LCC2 TaxID=2023057 RepID=A0A2I2L660_9VIRU|nr:Hypothetical protein ORPV_1128 [Orpheovirus IHUMI-LCC2]SNW63032.1 Hypothetical protein ORPV_1128 [Orpheovirus IHUMI-LCC2]